MLLDDSEAQRHLNPSEVFVRRAKLHCDDRTRLVNSGLAVNSSSDRSVGFFKSHPSLLG
jgi:hypothetical protein